MAETALVHAILIWLRLQGAMAWRNNSGRARFGKRWVAFGRVGSADILGVGPGGRALCIEVKTPAGTLSAAQSAFLAEAVARGAFAVCVHSIDELAAHWRVAFATEED